MRSVGCLLCLLSKYSSPAVYILVHIVLTLFELPVWRCTRSVGYLLCLLSKYPPTVCIYRDCTGPKEPRLQKSCEAPKSMQLQTTDFIQTIWLDLRGKILEC